MGICPYCRCGDRCGRERYASRPRGCRPSPPSSAAVYDALSALYGVDRTAPDADPRRLARDLVRFGYLGTTPRLVDVGGAQDLVREIER